MFTIDKEIIDNVSIERIDLIIENIYSIIEAYNTLHYKVNSREFKDFKNENDYYKIICKRLNLLNDAVDSLNELEELLKKEDSNEKES